MPQINKVIFEKKEIENIVFYLEATAKKIYHVNHSLFDDQYFSRLDFQNQHDRTQIKLVLMMAVASINRECQEIKKTIENTIVKA